MANQRNLTGEEAFAARSLITPLSFEDKWLHDLFDSKENVPPKHRLPKSEAFEEGEIPDHGSQRAPVPKSHASSILYSIPQWQPPPVARPETTFGGGEGPLSRPQHPNSKFSFWQDPRLRSVASTLTALPVENRQAYRPQNVANTHIAPPILSPIANTHIALPILRPIPDISEHDKLDRRIGIRPRGKTSAEVQFVLGSEIAYSPLPHAMLVIVHQFMVANKFISPRRHMSGKVKKGLWKSLLVRLDLHESYDLSRQQREHLSRAATRINACVDTESREWLAAGIYVRPSRFVAPTFHECTQAWLRRDWDGLITWPTQTTTLEPAMHTTSIRSEFEKAKIEERGPSINSLVSERSTHRRAEVVDLTNEENETRHTSSTSRKRQASDHADAPTPKRHRERVRPFADRFHKSLQPVLEEKEDIQFVRPYEKGFPMILDNIRHAHHTLEELAPKSARDLAALQQDWTDHGFPSSLTESLFVAQSYTLSMKSYLDNALDLLWLLEDCTSWKVEGENFQVQLEYEESAMQSSLSRTSESS